jgi:hypothetical protein
MAGDRSSLIDGGGLGVMDGGGAVGTGTANGPAAFVRHNMLISFGHFVFS